MKFLVPLTIILLLPTPVLAEKRVRSQAGYSEEQTCYEMVYREEYVPGTSISPGYVDFFREKVQVPCHDDDFTGSPAPTPRNVDDNSCIEGSILGALLGGGIGGAISREEGRWVAIPGGAVAGALIGCQIDGG